MSDQQMIATKFQNSMYLNVSDVIIIFIQQLQFYEQIHQNESEFTNNYFNYIQRVTQNSDIYNSCKFHQYPYEDETFNRKLQFVWLFKIINMLNYKLAFIPNLQFLFNCKTQNSFIIRDVAYLVYKDCLLEYGFLRNEISDMVESYSQFQVRESLQFYELLVFMLQINKKMKLFYDMRQQFALNSQSVRDVKWFDIDKKQLIEIEHYISKAKLLNTVQFKKSLMVPTQKNQLDNFQKFMLDPSLLENSILKEPTTAKYTKKNNDQQYSPLNSKQTKISNHSRQLSKN